MPRDSEILLALPQTLVEDGGGNAVRAEAADGEVVAIVKELTNRVGNGCDLIDQPPLLLGERRPGLIRVRGREEWRLLVEFKNGGVKG
jgi:hypothetical protein